MADAARNLLATYTPEQKAKGVFDYSSEERVSYHFVPMPRKGLTLADMSPAQRHLASALLGSPLSHRGYFKAVTIMSMEQVLFELENHAPHRNPEMYYVSLFGTPGQDVWGFRFEGHHLSLNFVLRGDEVLATTPSFLGTNPAEVRTGPRTGLRLLAAEDDLGLQFIKSLDDQQRAKAIFATNAPSEVITSDKRKAWKLEPLGLAGASLTPAQRNTLTAIIKEYIGRDRAELAEADWKKIEADGWENIHFAWAGATEAGQGHYYRVQGKTFLLEFDDTQNNANHVHAVWRDLESDFGDDILKRHYAETPHAK